MNNLYPIKAAVLTCGLAILVSFTAHADITELSDDSFTVKHSFMSKKSESLAKHQFGHVGWWWTSEYTQSGKGTNMFFDGKGLHERMPHGKNITHLKKIKRGHWTGALGKLRDQNVDGQMHVSIERVNGVTQVKMAYTVKSDKLKNNQSWPSHIDKMLAVQMNSLQTSLNNR